jgi:hypothetical protein
MVDLSTWAPGLREVGDGVWESGASAAVSYPSAGHDGCYELEDESFWFKHRNAVLVETLRRFPPGGPLLDVGGGNGCVTRALIGAGHESVLLEPGADGVRHAIARGVRPVIRATLDTAGLLPEALPAAGLFDVLEHVADELAFLQHLRTRIRRGGRCYVTVPAFGWLWSDADESAGHVRRYTRGQLIRSLERAGFRVGYATYCFALLPVPIFVLRTVRSRLARSRDLQARARVEHRPSSALGRAVLDRITRAECAVIRRGGRMPVGSSCLAVATA